MGFPCCALLIAMKPLSLFAAARVAVAACLLAAAAAADVVVAHVSFSHYLCIFAEVQLTTKHRLRMGPSTPGKMATQRDRPFDEEARAP